MKKNQAIQVHNLVNVAVKTIQDIADREQEILGSNSRDPRYVRAILLLQEKQRSSKHYVERFNLNG